MQTPIVKYFIAFHVISVIEIELPAHYKNDCNFNYYKTILLFILIFDNKFWVSENKILDACKIYLLTLHNGNVTYTHFCSFGYMSLRS